MKTQVEKKKNTLLKRKLRNEWMTKKQQHKSAFLLWIWIMFAYFLFLICPNIGIKAKTTKCQSRLLAFSFARFCFCCFLTCCLSVCNLYEMMRFEQSQFKLCRLFYFILSFFSAWHKCGKKVIPTLPKYAALLNEFLFESNWAWN